MNTMIQVTIPLTAIDARDKDNARVKYDGIETLAEEIKRDGLLHPMTVQATNKEGRYKLVIGFRRYKALKMLSEQANAVPEVTVNVLAHDLPETEALILQTVENMQREDLRPYEVADRCTMLTQAPHGLSGSQIARRLGKSPGYVNNLLRIVEGLAKPISDQWRSDNALCTTDLLAKWCRMEEDEQIKQFNARAGLDEDDEGNEGEGEEGEGEDGRGDGEGTGKKGRKRPSEGKLLDAISDTERALKEAESETGKQWLLGVRAGLRYAAGATKGIPNVTGARDKKEPKAPKEKKEPKAKGKAKGKSKGNAAKEAN